MTLPVRWQWGHLHVANDDAVFEDDDGARPPPRMPPHIEAIASNVAGDAELIALAASYEGAAALYVSLTHGRTYIRSPDDTPSGLPNAQAGSLVAHMRGFGETDLDVEFIRDGDKAEFARQMTRVNARLRELGWTQPPIDATHIGQLRKDIAAGLNDPDPAKAARARTASIGLGVIDSVFLDSED
jgi:hypothetical protein